MLPGDHLLTLGIASGGKHGNCPTHSHLRGVGRTLLCHGPGAEADWEKETLSAEIPATLLYCVQYKEPLSQPACYGK